MECEHCGDTGKIKKINDEESYDRLVDKYYETGQFNMIMAENMALKKVGFKYIACPYCQPDKK